MFLRALALLSLVSCVVACDGGDAAKSKPAAKPDAKAAAKPDAKAAAKAPAAKAPAGAPGATAKAPAAPAKPGALPMEATGPVARVNGVDVPARRFNDEVGKMAGRMPPGMAGRMKDQLLGNLVTEAIVEAAFAAEKLTVTDAAVNEEFAKFSKNMSERGPGGMAAFYAQSGTNEAEMKDRIKKSLTFAALLEKKGHSTKATDADAKKFYDENAKRFTRQDQVKASHILLKVEPGADAAKDAAVKKQAADLAKQAKAAGADFAALAKKHSQGPSGPRGGDLGFFEKNKMVPPFANAAWAMKKGDVSDPVKTRFGYHVIKLTDRKAGGVTPFAEAKEGIVAQLENTKRREASKKVIDELTKAAKVERLPANIKMNAPPPMPPAAPRGPGGPGGPGGLPNLGNMPKLKLKGLGADKPPAPKSP